MLNLKIMWNKICIVAVKIGIKVSEALSMALDALKEKILYVRDILIIKDEENKQ